MGERVIPILTRAGLDFYSRAFYECFFQVRAFQFDISKPKTWLFTYYRAKSQPSSTLLPMSLINGLLLHVFVLTTANYKLFVYGNRENLERFKERKSTKALSLEFFSEENVTQEAILGTGGLVPGTVRYIPRPGTLGKEYLEVLLDQTDITLDEDGTTQFTVTSSGGRMRGDYAGDFTHLSSRMKSFAEHFTNFDQVEMDCKFIYLYHTDTDFLLYSRNNS